MNDEQAKEAILRCVYNNDERNQFYTDQIADQTGIDAGRCRALCKELIAEKKLYYRAGGKKQPNDFAVVISHLSANELTNKGAYIRTVASENAFRRLVYSGVIIMITGASLSYMTYKEYRARHSGVQVNSTSHVTSEPLEMQNAIDTVRTN